MEFDMAEVSELFFSGVDNFQLPELYYNDVAISSPETLDWSSISGGGTIEVVESVSEREEDLKDVRVAHLLMAAAEAVAGDQSSRELAHVILARLSELLPPNTAAISRTDSLAAHFANALTLLLQDGRAPQRLHTEVMDAFQLLQDKTPYIKFGHFTANQAILDAVAGERRVHIIDFDIMEGVQWASLMQAFISNDSSPFPLLRITAVTRKDKQEVKLTGRRLVDFAASIGLPFTFRKCRLEPDGKFQPKAVKLVRGEAVVFNCALHAPHQAQHAASSIGSFLAGSAKLGARVVTVVEERGGDGREEKGFVGRFMEDIVRYSAVWDAVAAGLGKQGEGWEKVEREILAPRIAGAVGKAYREKEEGVVWAEWMAAAGFGRLGLSLFNYWQGKQLVGLFGGGYGVEEEALNRFTLLWKSRRLVSVSVWTMMPPAVAAQPFGIVNHGALSLMGKTELQYKFK